MRSTSITIPTLVRIKKGALDRLGIYAQRAKLENIVLLYSKDLSAKLIERAEKSLADQNIKVLKRVDVQASSSDQALNIFQTLPNNTSAVVGLGGGKALDVAKYVSFLARLPYIAAPTSLSNDGFCSPQSSLEVNGRRRSLPACMPYGVVVDTEVCLNAPRFLWASGIGDSVAKLTAVFDWKMAFRAVGTPVDDFAALLSDATVFQLMAKPDRDLQGIGLLATALMLNGIAMEICGSSRPASGSEHLISHALDLINPRPRQHGLQVGLATYLVSQLQKNGTERIAALFDKTEFWREIAKDPFVRADWLAAIKMAPGIKSGFYTILNEPGRLDELEEIIASDKRLNDLMI